MHQLKNKHDGIPGGFRYTQPESGMTLMANSFDALISKVSAHRRANNYPIGAEFEQQLMDHLCEKSPSACNDVPARQVIDRRRLTIWDALKFTGIMVADLLQGRPRESKEEATRRGSICAQCADNVQPEGCRACTDKKVQALVEKLAGAESTPYHGQLKSCKHCGCLNRAQIWFPLDILKSFMNNEQVEALPDHCWKKQ